MKLWPVVTGVAIALTLVACKSPTPPKGVKPISNFEASRYLGKWYVIIQIAIEVARYVVKITSVVAPVIAKIVIKIIKALIPVIINMF